MNSALSHEPTAVESPPRQPTRRRPGDALIIVDVQNDFLPGGALAVPDAHAVIAPLNRCAGAFERDSLPIFATRDWHPPDHCSFRERGGPWPPHCIADTRGADFPTLLALPRAASIVPKGTRRDGEAYSAFQGTDLAEQIRALQCTRVFVGGLATDYCVRASALDAHGLGLEVFLLEDAVRAVNLRAGDGERAMAEMILSGVHFCFSNELAA